MEQVSNWVRIRNVKLWISASFAVIIFGLLSYFSFVTHHIDRFPTTFLICISGFIWGWIIGVVTNSYEGDYQKINKFTVIVGAFLLGYIVSKYDKLFDEELNPSKILMNPYASRMLLFSCFFGLTWFIIFIYRNHIKVK
jgi:uncharacterized membrane protein